jgi:uncharacterized repeat protein (TIGR02543 family)
MSIILKDSFETQDFSKWDDVIDAQFQEFIEITNSAAHSGTHSIKFIDSNGLIKQLPANTCKMLYAECYLYLKSEESVTDNGQKLITLTYPEHLTRQYNTISVFFKSIDSSSQPGTSICLLDRTNTVTSVLVDLETPTGGSPIWTKIGLKADTTTGKYTVLINDEEVINVDDTPVNDSCSTLKFGPYDTTGQFSPIYIDDFALYDDTDLNIIDSNTDTTDPKTLRINSGAPTSDRAYPCSFIQKFVGNGDTIKSVKFYAKRIGTAVTTDEFYAWIGYSIPYPNDVYFPANGEIIHTSMKKLQDISTDKDWITLTFNNEFRTQKNIHYYIGIGPTNNSVLDNTICLEMYSTEEQVYRRTGTLFQYNSGGWQHVNLDIIPPYDYEINENLLFKVIGNGDLPKYTVTYNNNGADTGTPPTDNNQYLPNDTVTLKPNTGNLTKQGHILKGWDTNQNTDTPTFIIDDQTVTPSTFTMPENNVDLYAIWESYDENFIFEDNFETGDTSKWSSTVGSAASITNTIAHHGDYSLLIENNSSSLYKDLETNHDVVHTRFYLYLTDSENTDINMKLMEMRSHTEYHQVLVASYRIIQTSTGPEHQIALAIDGRTETYKSIKLRTNYWNCIETEYNKTTGIHKLWINSIEFLTNTTQVIYGAGHLYLGTFESDGNIIGDTHFDCIAVRKDYIGPEPDIPAEPTYTITYHGVKNTSGTVPVDNTQYMYGMTAIIKPNTGDLKRQGHKLSGWSYNSDTSTLDFELFGQYVVPPTILIDDTSIDLYAVWTPTPPVPMNRMDYVDDTANMHRPAILRIMTTDPSISAISGAGNSFTGNGANILAARFYIKRGGTEPPDTVLLQAFIYHHSGTFGNSSPRPEINAVNLYADALAVSETVIFNNIDFNEMWLQFDFPIHYRTIKDAHYFVVLAAISGTLINQNVIPPGVYFDIGTISAPQESLNGGNMFNRAYNNWNWISGSEHACILFEVLGDEPPPQPVRYTVTYNPNNADSGTAPVDPNQYFYGEQVTIAYNTGNLERTGHTFKGWSYNSNASNPNFTVNNTTVTPPAISIMGNTILYAVWYSEPINETYTVTYNPNGADSGSPPIDPNQYNHSDTVTVEYNTGNLAKTDHTLYGWSYNQYAAMPDFIINNTNITPPAFTITADTTLYAVWIYGDEPPPERADNWFIQICQTDITQAAGNELLYGGNSLIRVYRFLNANNTPFNPTDITIEIFDCAGKKHASINSTQLIYVDLGVYHFHWNLPNDARRGVWRIYITASNTLSKPTLSKTSDFTFNVEEKPTF